jgi:hypothetical protein
LIQQFLSDKPAQEAEIEETIEEGDTIEESFIISFGLGGRF